MEKTLESFATLFEKVSIGTDTLRRKGGEEAEGISFHEAVE